MENTRAIHYYSAVLFMFARMTAQLSCPMDLRKYPLDVQMCPLLIEPCEYLDHFTTSHSRKL